MSDNKQTGFTIVELLIAITVLNILLVSLLGVFSGYFASLVRSNIETQLTLESQQLLSSVTEDLRVAAVVRDTNLIDDPNNGSNWQTDEATDVLVIATPSLDGSRSFIIDPLTNRPFLDEIIYFQNSNVFYKRILANPNATGNRLSTTCPSAIATSSCPPDTEFTVSFADLSFEFFDVDDAVTTDATLARSIGVDIELLRDSPIGGDINLLNTSRITLRNQES